MKPMHVAALLIAYAPAMICSFGAVVLAANGVGGWGWFLGVGVLFGARSVSVKDGRP